jgi:hypothetical protein
VINLQDVRKYLRADFQHIGDGEMDEATKISLPASDWISGDLYKESFPRVEMESLFEPRARKEAFFTKNVHQNNNDCLVLAINILLR